MTRNMFQSNYSVAVYYMDRRAESLKKGEN